MSRRGTFRQARALSCATEAAHAAGRLMRRYRLRPKEIHEASRYDIRLALDIQCQKVIEKVLRRSFPDISVLGEEGILGDPQAAQRWVVDPIDGTVNFARGIPHACVSIALQAQKFKTKSPGDVEYETVVGVVYDPFCEELWTAVRGQPARMNGRIIKVSERHRLDEAIVMIGFAKSKTTLKQMLPVFNRVARRTLKVRMTGAAALALTYVASGRFDAYLEAGIRLWDIAAGGLILECAGGEFIAEPTGGKYCFRMLASNGKLRPKLEIPREMV